MSERTRENDRIFENGVRAGRIAGNREARFMEATIQEAIRIIRFAHHEHAFSDDHCTPANCSVAEWLDQHAEAAATSSPAGNTIDALDRLGLPYHPPTSPAGNGEPPDETDALLAEYFEARRRAVLNVVAHKASPPEYPGLALVPVSDIERLEKFVETPRTRAAIEGTRDAAPGLPIYCTGGCDACRDYARELGVPIVVPAPPSEAPSGETEGRTNEPRRNPAKGPVLAVYEGVAGGKEPGSDEGVLRAVADWLDRIDDASDAEFVIAGMDYKVGRTIQASLRRIADSLATPPSEAPSKAALISDPDAAPYQSAEAPSGDER